MLLWLWKLLRRGYDTAGRNSRYGCGCGSAVDTAVMALDIVVTAATDNITMDDHVRAASRSAARLQTILSGSFVTDGIGCHRRTEGAQGDAHLLCEPSVLRLLGKTREGHV